MSQGTNRREFLAQGGAFAAGGLWLAGSGAKALGYAANEKLNVAVIGVGGRGNSDMMDRGLATDTAPDFQRLAANALSAKGARCGMLVHEQRRPPQCSRAVELPELSQRLRVG